MAYIGIDLGGSYIRGAEIKDNILSEVKSIPVSSLGTEKEVLYEIFQLTDQLMNSNIRGIGVGVPSVVDVEKGIIYDVQNIPSWREVPLKRYMEQRYHVPVLINNDANCFALGEKHFGQGKNYHSFIGLTIGTGLGAGIIIHNKLYAGPNCGAGEFGMVNYLDKYFEYYASGQFFKNIYHTDGNTIFQRASAGEGEALRIFEEFGVHLGNAIKMILYTYDPEIIIIGGAIKDAYPYYYESMWEEMRHFGYPKSIEKFRIEVSELKNSGILGASGLCLDQME